MSSTASAYSSVSSNMSFVLLFEDEEEDRREFSVFMRFGGRDTRSVWRT